MKPVLFFDVDGTLTNPKKNEVPQSTIDTLTNLQKEGYLVCVSTGRTFENFKTTVAYDVLRWDGYVCANGQEVLNQDKTYIHKEVFSHELVEKVVDTCKNYHHVPIIVTDKRWEMLMEADDNVRGAMNFLHDPIPPVVEYTDQEVIAMIICADIGYDYQPYIDLQEVRPIPSYVNYCDLILSHASKSQGIRYFLEALGAKDYIAFGDSMNDYDMLEHATYSVAMGNGTKEIKEMADYVTTAVDEDGIQVAIGVLKDLNIL